MGPGLTDTSSSAMRVLPPTPGRTPAGGGFTDTSSSAKAGKTRVPVASKPAPAKRPTPKSTAKAPTASAPADPYGTNALVQAQVQPQLQGLAAQQTQLTEQQAQQQAAIKQATDDFLRYVTGQPSVQTDYANAAGQEGALGAAAASFLKGQNPNGDIQAQIAKLNPDQAAQIASQLGNVYDQGAGALFASRGLIPGSQLAENGAAAAAFQKSQAPNVALQGLQNVRQAAYGATQDNAALAQKRADVLAQIPGLTARAQAAAASQAATTNYRNAQLGLGQERVDASIANAKTLAGYRNAEFGLASAKYATAQNQFLARQTQQAKEFNARQTDAARKQSLPSSSLSGKLHYLVDAAGNPILNAKGQRQILPGYKLQNGVVVPRSGTGTTKGSLSASSVQSFVRGLSVTRKDTTTGKTVLNEDGTPATGHKMVYLTAYKYLRSRGVSDVNARTALDTSYKKGQDGRSWLTNEEQATLARAAKKTGYVGLDSTRSDLTRVHTATQVQNGKTIIHGYLTPAQFSALQAAGKAPAVQSGAPGGGYWIDPNG